MRVCVGRGAEKVSRLSRLCRDKMGMCVGTLKEVIKEVERYGRTAEKEQVEEDKGILIHCRTKQCEEKDLLRRIYVRAGPRLQAIILMKIPCCDNRLCINTLNDDGCSQW